MLLICVDDLRPDLGCMDLETARTPHLDQLAQAGRLFERHYVAVPTCGASRFALMTGRTPVEPASFGNDAFSLLVDQPESEEPESFAHLFKRAGYTTVSIGKISHAPHGHTTDGKPELPHSWDEVGLPAGKWRNAWDAFFAYADGSGRSKGESPPFEVLEDTDDTSYPDGLIAREAVGALRELGESGAPFVLAVGFFKPHLPWCAPKTYWDRHPMAEVDLPTHKDPPAEVDASITLHPSDELLRNYGGYQGDPRVDDDYARHLRRAYRASVSYVDAQVGKVLAALEDEGLAENTIVVLWSDHGWHLGEHGVWGKHTLHERSLRSPLIMRTPGLARPGEATSAIVRSVDVYPTLVELCGLERPDGLAGASLVPQLEDPGRATSTPAQSWWRKSQKVTGTSLRSDRWRVTLWERDGQLVLTELYDHEKDPEETVNVAGEHLDVVERLLGSE